MTCSTDAFAAEEQVSSSRKESLRKFSEIHIGEDCKEISGHKQNALFHECEFEKVNGLVLEQCVLARSSFDPKAISDMLDLTVTLNCFTFKDLKLNELAFDTMLLLLTFTSGNDEKRNKLVEVIGKRRYIELLRMAARLEKTPQNV